MMLRVGGVRRVLVGRSGWNAIGILRCGGSVGITGRRWGGGVQTSAVFSGLAGALSHREGGPRHQRGSARHGLASQQA